MSERVAEHRVAPLELSGQAARVRIDHQLVRIEAMAFVRRVGAMDAIAVQQARSRFRQVAVPDLVGALAQRDALQLASSGGIEDAELHPLRELREQREIDA